MKTIFRAVMAVGINGAALAGTAAGVEFQFNCDYDTTGFFGVKTQARATLEAAGRFYSGLLGDHLEALSSPNLQNTWSAVLINPSTGDQVSVQDLFVPADTLVVFVGARNLGGILGWSGSGGWSAKGTEDWITTVRTRGQGTTTNPGATDFGPWGGQLSLNNAVTWNANYLALPTAGQNDLYSVILHELGHVLGLGACDSWKNRVSGTQFTGPAAAAEHGGPVPLAGASDTSHWQQGTMSHAFTSGASQEVALDPSIMVGTRKLLTDLDVLGLRDVGWQVPLWNGGASGNNWTSGGNWGGSAPAPPAVLKFSALASGGHAGNFNDFAAGTQFNGITFISGAPAYNLLGKSITLGGPVLNQSARDQSISLDMVLASGGGSFDTGTRKITVSGAISGSGPLIKIGGGELTLSGADSFRGGTVVNQGVLQISSAGGLPAGRGLTIGAGGGLALAGGAAIFQAAPEPGSLVLLIAGALLAAAAWGRSAMRSCGSPASAPTSPVRPA
jgi:autotransporter-associated beta strand protein